MDSMKTVALRCPMWVLTLALATAMAECASAQTFQRQYGHPERWLTPRDQVQASDGGFVICGESFLVDSSASRPFLMKLDEAGDVLWAREYERLSGHHCAASLVRRDGPGGDLYVVLVQHGELEHPVLMAVSSTGTFLAAKAYTSPGAPLDMDHLVARADGGWLLVGRTFDTVSGHDAAVLALDATGTAAWFRTLAGSIDFPLFGSDDTGLGVRETAGGDNVVVSAMVDSDAYLGLWDGDGGAPRSDAAFRLQGGFVFERILALVLTRTGRRVVVASADLANDRFPLIMEIDDAGRLIGAQALSVPMSASRALATSDGGFVIAGSSLITPGRQGLRLVKFDGNLVRQWAWQYDATPSFASASPPTHVIETDDGGFLLTRAAQDGLDPVALVVRTGPLGELECGAQPLPPAFAFDVEMLPPPTTSTTATVEDVIVTFDTLALDITASPPCPGPTEDRATGGSRR